MDYTLCTQWCWQTSGHSHPCYQPWLGLSLHRSKSSFHLAYIYDELAFRAPLPASQKPGFWFSRRLCRLRGLSWAEKSRHADPLLTLRNTETAHLHRNENTKKKRRVRGKTNQKTASLTGFLCGLCFFSDAERWAAQWGAGSTASFILSQKGRLWEGTQSLKQLELVSMEMTLEWCWLPIDCSRDRGHCNTGRLQEAKWTGAPIRTKMLLSNCAEQRKFPKSLWWIKD